jgi:hypothetical protein
MSEPLSNEKWQEKWKKLCDVTRAKTIFTLIEGKKYNIAFNTSKSTAVAITQVGVNKNSATYSVLRLDRPHTGHHNYNHLNINPKVSGKADPHVQLPPGSIQVSYVYIYVELRQKVL